MGTFSGVLHSYEQHKQGTYGALAQSLIYSCWTTQQPDFLLAHTELLSCPWRQRAAYLACLIPSSLILSLQFTYAINLIVYLENQHLSWDSQTSFWVGKNKSDEPVPIETSFRYGPFQFLWAEQLKAPCQAPFYFYYSSPYIVRHGALHANTDIHRPPNSCSYGVQHYSHVTHTSIARKRTGDAEIGRRPAPEKIIETILFRGKKKYLVVDLGRDTRTSTQLHRIVRRKGASWSLNWLLESGANLHA